MDYVDGHSLDSNWDQISLDAQTNVVTQVAAMVNQLQSIHSDKPGVIGVGLSRGTWFSDYGAGTSLPRKRLRIGPTGSTASVTTTAMRQ
jgi:hypothetical protein